MQFRRLDPLNLLVLLFTSVRLPPQLAHPGGFRFSQGFDLSCALVVLLREELEDFIVAEETGAGFQGLEGRTGGEWTRAGEEECRSLPPFVR